MGVFLSLNGVYCMKNYRDARGRPCNFGCRLLEISPDGMSLIVPVQGRIGEQVETNFEEFGPLHGKISKKIWGGFALDIVATDDDRRTLAAKIAWLQKFHTRKVEDQRKHKRIIPTKPLSIMIMVDGTYQKCLIIDVSVSGVAVSSEIMPDVGTALAIGRVVGKVVRHLPAGFAVQFLETHDLSTIEHAINYVPREIPKGFLAGEGSDKI